MQFLKLALASASLLSSASAIISGIAVPDVIQPGQGFNIRILSENYIQAVYDVSIAVGAAPASIPSGYLSTVLDSFYLGPSQSNLGNTYITKWVAVPSSYPLGAGNVTASVFSLLGAASEPNLENYNVSTTFGTYTSNNYVYSS